MRARIAWAALAFCLAGCQLQDENPQWDPQQEYPSWAYDSPFYYRPSEDLPVADTLGASIPVYYTNSQRFFVKHSSGYQVPGVPRLGVWFSSDEGRSWQRAGFFGAEQTHFLFQAGSDGVYWIRFVGPGQGAVDAPPGTPHRIYVADAAAPQIELNVEPPPVTTDEKGNPIPRIYQVGEMVVVSWQVRDANLAESSVHLATTFAKFPDNVVWSKFPISLPAVGSMKVPIPPEAAGKNGHPGGGMRFRVEARDKPGNRNCGFSEILQVAAGTAPPRQVVVRPADPWELVVQTDGVPGDRPGWPDPGALVRGGSSRMLQWLPSGVDKHKHVVLEFSANNGRSWRTVAEGLQEAKPIKWTVPLVNSRICRLRILAIQGPEHKLMLAQSMPFTVHTAPAAIQMGPVEIPLEVPVE